MNHILLTSSGVGIRKKQVPVLQSQSQRFRFDMLCDSVQRCVNPLVNELPCYLLISRTSNYSSAKDIKYVSLV